MMNRFRVCGHLREMNCSGISYELLKLLMYKFFFYLAMKNEWTFYIKRRLTNEDAHLSYIFSNINGLRQ